MCVVGAGVVGRGWFKDGSSALRYCALYFHCYYISSTSGYQALDSKLGTPGLVVDMSLSKSDMVWKHPDRIWK